MTGAHLPLFVAALLPWIACESKPEERRSGGLLEVCRGTGPEGSGVIVVDQAFVGTGKRRPPEARRIRSFELATGKVGRVIGWTPPDRFQNTAYCLGGAGTRAWMRTEEQDVHLRELATGEVAVSHAELDRLVPKAVWERVEHEPMSQGLMVYTTFGDKVLIRPDGKTAQPMSTKGEPGVSPSRSEILLQSNMTSCRWEGPFAFACDGSRCRLAPSADGYNDNRAKEPFAEADTLLVAKRVRVTPDGQGILVSHLTSLDESTRSLSRLSLRGKRVWTLPGVTDHHVEAYTVGDDTAEAAPHTEVTENARKADILIVSEDRAWLVEQATGRVRWQLQHKAVQRSGSPAVALRLGAVLLFAAKTSLLAVSIKGEVLWTAQL